MASRAALVVEDGQDLTACYAIEPASVNVSSCYRLWHVFSPLSEVGFTGFKDFQDCGIGVRNPSHNRTTTNYSLGSGFFDTFPSYKPFFVSLAAECFDFGDGMLDGCVARWGVRDVDRATGGKLGDEPPIVWGPRLPMDDDRCPADAYIGNEVRRRNLLSVVVKAFPDGYVKLDRFVSEHSF